MQMANLPFKNPFRPGAGHMPPYLAGRELEEEEFRRLLAQDDILENMILTGLRGVGKTVLLEAFKPIAIQENWLWLGTDLSEASSINEENLIVRLLADLSVVTSSIVTQTSEYPLFGFSKSTVTVEENLDFEALVDLYKRTPGLPSDKLKHVLAVAWRHLREDSRRGIIFAYDEAQNLADHAKKEQFPLSLLLDVFQSVQRQGIPFMLALVGLPTLFPKLVEARTYSERMFHILLLDRLSPTACKDAIVKPVETGDCPISFDKASVDTIAEVSGGYPYFIQFICREVFDIWIQKHAASQTPPPVPVEQIMRKLDVDFFAGRWARTTDRQRELLQVIAHLDNADEEFACQDVVALSKEILDKPFSTSHVNQMLVSLSNAGLVYKNRHGRYSFAVPLLGQFILRQTEKMP